MKYFSLQNIPVFAFILIFSISSKFTYCQNFNVNFALGGSNYQGDLSNSYISSLKPALSGGFTLNLFSNIRLRTNLSFLQIGSDDAKSPNSGAVQRNLNFKSNIFEGAELLEIDLLNSEDNNIVPYVFGGPSIFHFDPTTTVAQADIDHFKSYFPNVSVPFNVGQKIHLHDIGTEGQLFHPLNINTRTYPSRVYDLTLNNWQLGGGVRVQLSEAISIAYEFSFRKLNTDYLDDVSAINYIGRNEFESQINEPSIDQNRMNLLRQGEVLSWKYTEKGGLPKGNPDKPRGNPNQNDAYFSNQIRINITLFDFFSGLGLGHGEGGGGSWGGGKEYFGSRKKLYSPRYPFGTGQLKCPKIY